MQPDETQQEVWTTPEKMQKSKFVWKRLPDEQPDCTETNHTHEPPPYQKFTRLFKDGIAMGDYAVSNSKDCRVLFYTHALLNAPARVYGIVNEKMARAYLMRYAITGHLPEGPPDPHAAANQAMNQGQGMPSNPFGGFHG